MWLWYCKYCIDGYGWIYWSILEVIVYLGLFRIIWVYTPFSDKPHILIILWGWKAWANHCWSYPQSHPISEIPVVRVECLAQNCEILRSNHFPERNSQVLMVYRHQNWRCWDVGLMVLPYGFHPECHGVPYLCFWPRQPLVVARRRNNGSEHWFWWRQKGWHTENRLYDPKNRWSNPMGSMGSPGKGSWSRVFFFQLCPHVLCYATGVLLRMLAPERKTRHIGSFQWARGAGI